MSRTCDVLVIGSGAGGLSAAITAAHAGLDVIVAEKTPLIGGTTAWSGGWLWIPRNPLAVAAGIVEGIEGPLEYLRHEIGNRVEDPRIRAFLETGPEMVTFFRDHSQVDWIDGNRMPDFHDLPGSLQGGRSVSVAPYDARALGPWAARLRPPLAPTTIAGMALASGADMGAFFNWFRSPCNAAHVALRLARHAVDLAVAGRSRYLVNGNALAARLLRSALDLGVDVRTGAPATELMRDGARITGAVVGGAPITARRGVVLATGGFPHDRARIAEMFDHAPTGAGHHSAAPETNSGDGLRLGEAAGAGITRDTVNAGAWAPVSLVPGKDGPARFPHLVERAKPGIIAVGPDGQRFVNEADSYHDFMTALFRTGADHAWIIADAQARRRYGIGAVKPWPFPDRPHLASGYLARARTLEALAARLGLPGLVGTVARFNAGAETGSDPDFRRGASPYNRVQGDAFNAPNPSLRPLTRGPFYAVRVVPGSLGTFAGLRTDTRARVLDEDGRVIDGLYATGNDAASIFGGHYPSGGITLGPAMTFGYIAGRDLARGAD
ncbi:FAD-dependent oxidoreductase [Mesobacterium pallidum]|uniref:FAD-dependent oxidoreductase n=1 Tax=Mesobacterium pallidum TaxID=2872037 RepID=UPI001EE37ADD|nr:FAD-dependent oxidoreductase [Mesobacterium pallidum]